MDIYWSYLIQRDQPAKSEEKLIKEQKEKDKNGKEWKGMERKEDKTNIPSQCGQCGQNHYWCQCYNKV